MPSVDGIVSGLDTTALIGAILDVAAVPGLAMDDQLTEYEEQLEAVSGLTNRLNDLVSAIEDIDELTELPSYVASLSEEGSLDVTADSEAIPGSYDIEVLATATAEVEISDGYSDATSTGVIAEGTLTVTYAGTDYDVTIDSDNSSLEGVAAAIDDVDGLTAYVMDTGDATDPYRLVVQADETGADNTVEFDTSGLGGGGSVPSFTENSSAGDAEISINGISIYSDDNSFNDVIPGLSIDALQVTDDPVTVTVSLDDEAIEEKMQAFVDAYNEVISYYNTQTSYNDEEGIRGGLVGDSSARGVIDSLGRMISGSFDVDTDISALSQLGISTESDGTISFDADEFSDALDADLEDVFEFLTHDDEDAETYGVFATLRDTISDVYVDEYEGTLSLRSETLEETIADTEERLEDFNLYLDNYEERLRDQFTYMETVLAELQANQSYLAALFSSSTS